MADPKPEPPRGWNPDGFAIALIAVGALILALCGSCTGVFAGSALWSIFTSSSEAGLGFVILLTAAVVGGIPTAGGLVLLMVGIGRARRDRKPPPPTTFD